MYSMTGFGSYVLNLSDCKITVEIRSINHRYCEVNIHMPNVYNRLEEKLRRLLKEKVKRGKCTMTVSIDNGDGQYDVLEPNWNLIEQYINGFEQISSKFKLSNDLSLSDLMKLDNVFVSAAPAIMASVSDDEILTAAEKAIADFLGMRNREGLALKKTLYTYFQQLGDMLVDIEEIAPRVRQNYFNKLKDHIDGFLDGRLLDEDRLYNEAASFGDKCNIDEEIIRLKSHLEQCDAMLESEIPIGRKFDFLIQEMNREVNTIGSKANDIDISQRVVEMKSILEKAREQVQNIE